MKKVYLSELEKAGTELVNYSKDDIANKIDELKLLTKNLEWNGMGYDVFIEGYNNKINRIIKWNNNLSTIASFLLTAKNDYLETSEDIEKKYVELIDELEELEKTGRY